MPISERVAVPPEVAGGTTTSAYVPPLNGKSSAWPLRVFVHAVEPDAAAMAVNVVVNVPSEARDSLSTIRLPSERTTCPGDDSVAVQATVPVERTAGILCVAVLAVVSTVTLER